MSYVIITRPGPVTVTVETPRLRTLKLSGRLLGTLSTPAADGSWLLTPVQGLPRRVKSVAAAARALAPQRGGLSTRVTPRGHVRRRIYRVGKGGDYGDFPNLPRALMYVQKWRWTGERVSLVSLMVGDRPPLESVERGN